MADWNGAHRKWDSDGRSNEQYSLGGADEPAYAPNQLGANSYVRRDQHQYRFRADPGAGVFDHPLHAYATGPFVGIPNMPQNVNMPHNVNMQQDLAYSTRRNSKSSESYGLSYPPSIPQAPVDEEVWVSEAWRSLKTRSQSSRSVTTKDVTQQLSWENIDEPSEREPGTGDTQSESSHVTTAKDPQFAQPSDFSPKQTGAGKSGPKSTEDLSGTSSIEDRHSSVNSELELTSSAPSSCVWNPPNSSKQMDSNLSQAETKILEKVDEQRNSERKGKTGSPSNTAKKRKERDLPDDIHYGRYDDDSEWTLGPGEPKWKSTWSR